MKKYLVGLCLGILVMGMTACGAKDNVGSGQNTGTQGSSSGVAGTESQTGGEASNTAPSDMTPSDTEDGWSAEMQAVRDAVATELGENYWPNLQVPKEQMESMIGISSDVYEDYFFEMPMMSAHVDAILVAKAKEGQTESLEKAVKAYQDNLKSNTMQYPMNIGKIQASKVETVGQYVCFVQLGGDTTGVEEKGDEAVIVYCQEENDKVLGIIKEKLSAQ